MLFCILMCQMYVAVMSVYFRPTVGSWRTATGWTSRVLRSNIPLVDIHDDVDVNVKNDVDVNVTNRSLDVGETAAKTGARVHVCA
jgi:hypothetical protein